MCLSDVIPPLSLTSLTTRRLVYLSFPSFSTLCTCCFVVSGWRLPWLHSDASSILFIDINNIVFLSVGVRCSLHIHGQLFPVPYICGRSQTFVDRVIFIQFVAVSLLSKQVFLAVCSFVATFTTFSNFFDRFH